MREAPPTVEASGPLRLTKKGRTPMDIDTRLLDEVARVAAGAGDRLLALYSPDARPAGRDELLAAANRNEEASSAGLRDALRALRPQARWLEQENETGPLPGGEWWVVANVEGSVNHVHGLPEWGVSITLVADGVPSLGVFRQPVADLTYTALRGHGAYRGGRRLAVSRKSGLELAVVGTGQAEAGQAGTFDRIGRSVTALLGQAFLVRATVPSTFPLLLVAGGHTDAFWQYEPVLPGIALGILLATEAGGIVSAANGRPWTPAADTVLVAAPGVHAAMARALGEVG
jgi:myo-inositol-1(or 4)-monophosphatase